MTRELYQLLVRTKELCEEANKQLKEMSINYKFDLPPIYYKNMGRICLCDFLLNNEESKKNTKKG